MPKYYVQCGPIEVVLSADSVAQAALAALDRSLQAHLWIYDDPDLSDRDQHDHLMLEALLHLSPTIRVSERGFSQRRGCCGETTSQDGATLVGTPETIEQWHQLMVGMNRLFVAAGLAPRSMSSVAGVPTASQCELDGDDLGQRDRSRSKRPR